MLRILLAVWVWVSVWGQARAALEIEGEVLLELRVPGQAAGQDLESLERWTPDSKEWTPDPSDRPELRGKKEPRNVTAAEPVDCVYQYPETKQIDAMVSNMMNQLTKVFVRVHQYMTSRDTRRQGLKRFKLVSSKQTSFFDTIYSNMIKEYRQAFNETQERVPRASDPCSNQDEIRDVWRQLLDTSEASVHRAAMRCVEEYMKVQPRTSAAMARTRNHAEQLLRSELARARADQLTLLCDHFQLCYNELL